MDLAGQHGLLGNSESSEDSAIVRAIYAIPDTSHLDDLVKRRSEVLEKLETAEARYIRSFKANPMAERPQAERAPELESASEKRSSFLPVSCNVTIGQAPGTDRPLL